MTLPFNFSENSSDLVAPSFPGSFLWTKFQIAISFFPHTEIFLYQLVVVTYLHKSACEDPHDSLHCLLSINICAVHVILKYFIMFLSAFATSGGNEEMQDIILKKPICNFHFYLLQPPKGCKGTYLFRL